MGIKGLAKLLSDEAPGCIKEVPLSSLQGRKVAIDASMAIYQFLIAVRTANNNNNNNAAAMMLTNAQGESTSHIQGFFNRTIRFLTEGIRPVYVFDGVPPEMKSHELSKRREKVKLAQEALKTAQEEGDVEEQDKQSKRLVRAGNREKEDCVRLLQLMGVPIIRAPCEAEAQCAALNRKGLVWAVATEDMDALTFQAPVLLRKMTFASSTAAGNNKGEIQQMEYDKALTGLGLDHAQFVDLCILLGCDYCDTIRGVGPKTALKLIREYGCIEKILQNIDKSKYGIPESWEAPIRSTSEQSQEDFVPVYIEARKLFNHHEVLTDVDIKWSPCQPEELTAFLVDEMGFNADRVKSSIEKLQKAFTATSKPQMRMDSFFKPVASTHAAPQKNEVLKRKGTGDGGNKVDNTKKAKGTSSGKGGPAARKR